MEENLWKSQANNDRLKEEQEKLMQEKDKLHWMAETEIERLKEEIWQQKEREDRACSQINWRLKHKTDDFEKLHQDQKQMEVEHKKLGSDLTDRKKNWKKSGRS